MNNAAGPVSIPSSSVALFWEVAVKNCTNDTEQQEEGFDGK